MGELAPSKSKSEAAAGRQVRGYEESPASGGRPGHSQVTREGSVVMNPFAIDHELLTIKELCDLLRVHRATVYKLTREGKIPHFRIGGGWRFHRDVIERWMAEQTMGAPQ
jgi:excisionase family DNA binding protein